MEKKKKSTEGFEESLTRLERIVAELESGELPLERSLAIFEEGVGLARVCQKHLADAERKVEMLVKERGELKSVPFDPAQKDQEATTARKLADDDGDDEADEEDDDDDGLPF